jgi:N-acetylglucosaminyl-diphospho-decaprenol L-rhamnosyltransferase
VLTAWAYGLRALLPRPDRARMRLHASRALLPNRGEGLREAAEQYNRGLTA